MTLNLYSHLLTDTLDRATDLMAARFADAESAPAQDTTGRLDGLDTEGASEPGPEGEGS